MINDEERADLQEAFDAITEDYSIFLLALTSTLVKNGCISWADLADSFPGATAQYDQDIAKLRDHGPEAEEI